jgi:uncharacterized membrane protein (UPF0182 family)
MHGSRYHSIAWHCIVLHVKFDGGLSMSVLKNRQLFTKKKEDKKFTFSKKLRFSNKVQIFEVSEHRFQKAVGYFESVETSWSQ